MTVKNRAYPTPDKVFGRCDVIWGRRNDICSLDCNNVTISDDQQDGVRGKPTDQFSMSRGHVSIGPLHKLPLALNVSIEISN